ncbi:MAG: DUF3006 domain-containing protein [Patescibacteria group bacterium]|jgi:hypothetical protein
MIRKEKNTTEHEYSLDRFEGDKAVLLDENDEELILPKKLLSKEIVEGKIVVLTISDNEVKQIEKEKQAKDILNEILDIKE